MALKTMDTRYKRAKEMVRYVKGHQVIAASYLTKQSEKNLRLFESDNEPSSTRLEHDSEDEASESDVQEVDIE